MLKKTIEYKDFNNEVRKEDFYFNLTEAEITEMELSTTGGLQALMERMVSTRDTKQLVVLFKDIIMRSYGEKSLDGRKFVKNDTLREDFAQTNAYSVLFMELAGNEVAAAAFMNGIVPAELAERAATEAAITGDDLVPLAQLRAQQAAAKRPDQN